METKTLSYEEQATDFLTKTGVEFKAEFLKYDFYFEDDKEPRDIYEITLKRGDRKFTFRFGQSIVNSGGANPIPPTAYDVLACLEKYDHDTFEDFCSEFGYDNNSISVKKTYKAVKKEFAMVQALWTDDEIEELMEIN